MVASLEQGWIKRSRIIDFNNDGWLDIYQCVDAGGNDLWINQKQKTQPTFVQGATGDRFQIVLGKRLIVVHAVGDSLAMLAELLAQLPSGGNILEMARATTSAALARSGRFTRGSVDGHRAVAR